MTTLNGSDDSGIDEQPQLKEEPPTSTTTPSVETSNTITDHRDRGRAWLVLVGSFFAGLLSLGNALSLGVLFNHIAVKMPTASTPSINAVFALTAGLTYIGGTASPNIIRHIGFRYTMLIGAILACIGFATAALASQMWHLYLTLGVITGSGFGLIFTPSVGVVGQHFNVYKHFAVTTATMGIPLGIIAFSMFHHHVAQAAGFSVCMLANAGACFGLILCAFAVKDAPPPPPPTSPAMTQKKNKSAAVCRPEHQRTFFACFSKRKNSTKNSTAVVDPSSSRRESYETDMTTSTSTTITNQQHTSDGSSTDESNNNNDNIVAPTSSSSENSSGRESPTNFIPLLLDNDKVGTVNGGEPPTNFVKNLDSLPTLQQVDELPIKHSRRRRQNYLLCQPKMWWLLLEGLGLVAINIYLIITPVYLVRSKNWSRTHAALVVMTHGVSSITTRVLVMLLNAYPRVGDRISKSAQAAFGITCVFACSLAYFLSFLLPSSNVSVVDSNNSTNFETTVPSTEMSGHGEFFQETNAAYFFAFALINGAGHTFFLAYQPSIVLDVLGARNLTQAFGYMSFVWGVACLVLYPMAGKIGDLFGSLHTAYLMACACCVCSAVALCALGCIQRIERRKRRRQLVSSKRQSEP